MLQCNVTTDASTLALVSSSGVVSMVTTNLDHANVLFVMLTAGTVYPL
jgi:hypothetical protein